MNKIKDLEWKINILKTMLEHEERKNSISEEYLQQCRATWSKICMNLEANVFLYKITSCLLFVLLVVAIIF